jgi:hypothetical protein
MSEQQRPTSQTIIDLTDDSAESTLGGVNARFLHRRPYLRRRDALAFEDIIDLTNADSQPESARPDQQTQQANNHHRFLHDDSILEYDIQLTHRAGDEGLGGLVNYIPAWAQGENLYYNQHPFARPRQAPKPQHQSPPAAQEGFTRSPTEGDIVICPACQKELVAQKGKNEPPFKKPGSKAPNKKDREEHPFWVVKECGHVRFQTHQYRSKPTVLGLLQRLLSPAIR